MLTASHWKHIPFFWKWVRSWMYALVGIVGGGRGWLGVGYDCTTNHCQYHSGWTPFYFMYDPKCSTTFPWCTINAPAAFAWCTINVPAVFARCTNRFVHKVEFSYIGWNGVHPLWIWFMHVIGLPIVGGYNLAGRAREIGSCIKTPSLSADSYPVWNVFNVTPVSVKWLETC